MRIKRARDFCGRARPRTFSHRRVSTTYDLHPQRSAPGSGVRSRQRARARRRGRATTCVPSAERWALPIFRDAGRHRSSCTTKGQVCRKGAADARKHHRLLGARLLDDGGHGFVFIGRANGRVARAVLGRHVVQDAHTRVCATSVGGVVEGKGLHNDVLVGGLLELRSVPPTRNKLAVGRLGGEGGRWLSPRVAIRLDRHGRVARVGHRRDRRMHYFREWFGSRAGAVHCSAG